MIEERPALKSAFRSRSTVVKGAGQSLSEYAMQDSIIVLPNLSSAHGSVMVKMAGRDIRSSVHVSVTVAGQRGTVNFWSSEVDAFPPPAVPLLERFAHLTSGQSPSATTAQPSETDAP